MFAEYFVLLQNWYMWKSGIVKQIRNMTLIYIILVKEREQSKHLLNLLH